MSRIERAAWTVGTLVAAFVLAAMFVQFAIWLQRAQPSVSYP